LTGGQKEFINGALMSLAFQSAALLVRESEQIHAHVSGLLVQASDEIAPVLAFTPLGAIFERPAFAADAFRQDVAQNFVY